MIHITSVDACTLIMTSKPVNLTLHLVISHSKPAIGPASKADTKTARWNRTVFSSEALQNQLTVQASCCNNRYIFKARIHEMQADLVCSTVSLALLDCWPTYGHAYLVWYLHEGTAGALMTSSYVIRMGPKAPLNVRRIPDTVCCTSLATRGPISWHEDVSGKFTQGLLTRR